MAVTTARRIHCISTCYYIEWAINLSRCDRASAAGRVTVTRDGRIGRRTIGNRDLFALAGQRRRTRTQVGRHARKVVSIHDQNYAAGGSPELDQLPFAIDKAAPSVG